MKFALVDEFHFFFETLLTMSRLFELSSKLNLTKLF